MKWALAFATARVFGKKIEFLEVPIFYLGTIIAVFFKAL